MRDDTRTSPDVLGYLRAENAYREAMTASLQPLEAELYREIVGRIRQDDSSVPYRDNGYWYLHRYGVGDEYPVYARRAGSAEGPEQVLLDLRENARGSITTMSAQSRSATTTTCSRSPKTRSVVASTRCASSRWSRVNCCRT